MRGASAGHDVVAAVAVKVGNDQVFDGEVAVVDDVPGEGQRGRTVGLRVVDPHAGARGIVRRAFVLVALADDDFVVGVVVEIGGPGGMAPGQGLVNDLAVPEVLARLRRGVDDLEPCQGSIGGDVPAAVGQTAELDFAGSLERLRFLIARAELGFRPFVVGRPLQEKDSFPGGRKHVVTAVTVEVHDFGGLNCVQRVVGHLDRPGGFGGLIRDGENQHAYALPFTPVWPLGASSLQGGDDKLRLARPRDVAPADAVQGGLGTDRVDLPASFTVAADPLQGAAPIDVRRLPGRPRGEINLAVSSMSLAWMQTLSRSVAPLRMTCFSRVGLANQTTASSVKAATSGRLSPLTSAMVTAQQTLPTRGSISCASNPGKSAARAVATSENKAARASVGLIATGLVQGVGLVRFGPDRIG